MHVYKKRKNLSKKESESIHAILRGVERYGCLLSRSDLHRIVKKIQSKDGMFIEKKTNRVTIWDVEYNKTIFKVVYDKKRKMVVTFLPSDTEDI